MRPGLTVRLRALLLALALTTGLLLAGPTVAADAAVKPPAGAVAHSRSVSSIQIGWREVRGAAAYRVQYAANAKFRQAAYLRTAGPVAEIGGLKPATTYYVRIRALRASGKGLTGYGKAIRVTTRTVGDFALLSPSGLAASATSDNTVSLNWTPRDGAVGYRVRWAMSRKLAGEEFLRVYGGTSAVLADLSPGTTYYVSVRAITATGENLSQYSPMIAVRTTGRASFAPPSGLSVKASSATSATIAWAEVPGVASYRIKYATQQWTDAEYQVSTGTTTRLTGLQPDTTYYFKVRALNAEGEFASDYSEVVNATTPPAPIALRVASYNIRCHNCGQYAEEQPWRVRRDYVADTIIGADPDVVALQEAQQSKLIDDGTVSQFEDLRNLLNQKAGDSSWALTNSDRKVANGSRIIFNTARVERVSQGSTRLPASSPDNPEWVDPRPYPRWVTWAIFAQKGTGSRFLLANVHLEPRNDDGGDNPFPGTTFFGNIRREQARAALARVNEVNTAGLPVILAGDLASSRAEYGGNLPYRELTAGGLVDPLGNVSASSPAGASVEYRVPTPFGIPSTAYNSVNKFERVARRSSGLNGAYNDYLLVSRSPSIRVAEFEQVLNLDAAGRFVGVIPSDHNLIRATLWLPQPTDN